MINYREEILSGLAEVIRSEFPDVTFVDKEESSDPPVFPYVVAKQTSNNVIDRHSTFTNLENAVAEAYQMQVYDYDESTITAIMDIANEYMLERGYRRNLYEPIPNYADTSINRYIAGWRNFAVI